MEMAHDGNSEPEAQPILNAASRHDYYTLRTLLRKGSANVQDLKTGYTPLHSAIAACKQSLMQSIKHDDAFSLQSVKSEQTICSADSEQAQLDEVEAASKTMRLLLQNGAIWNDLDRNNETPGCLALRLGLITLYDIMVDAGVRAEMLLNRLDDYEMLQDEEDEEDENEENKLGTADGGTIQDEQLGENLDPVTVTTDATPSPALSDAGGKEITSKAYLKSDLTFSSDRLLDDDNNGVMMAWESEIMQRTAELLTPRDGMRILNIGHGMGIIDEFFQAKSPSSHHIIEAHPDAIKRMKVGGWYEKSNVKIHEGKWQDIVPKLIEEAMLFDVIYFDTFAEDYKALREFFSEYVIGLLDDGGKWGFFNGLGADRQICYDVYLKVTEMDLFEAGYDVDWVTLRLPDLENEWKGVKRRYFALDEYKLPVCTFIG